MDSRIPCQGRSVLQKNNLRGDSILPTMRSSFGIEFFFPLRLLIRVKIMYAIIESGGKQYRVAEGEILKVEKLEAEAGNTVDFDRVLMVGEGESVQFGAPLIEGATVSAEILKHGRADKIRIIKFRRRKHHMKRAGHRQYYTQVKITAVNV